MKYPLTSKQQCQQLVNVLDYLKSQNKKQKKIAEKVLRNGKMMRSASMWCTGSVRRRSCISWITTM